MAEFIGTSGNDSYSATAAADVIRGLAGNDILAGNDGADRINGGAGDDMLDGGADSETLENGLGNDKLLGGVATIRSSSRAGVFSENDVLPIWTVAQVNDFNGDGRDDLVFRNLENGAFSTWQSNGDAFDRNVIYDISVATNWSILSDAPALP